MVTAKNATGFATGHQSPLGDVTLAPSFFYTVYARNTSSSSLIFIRHLLLRTLAQLCFDLFKTQTERLNVPRFIGDYFHSSNNVPRI